MFSIRYNGSRPPGRLIRYCTPQHDDSVDTTDFTYILAHGAGLVGQDGLPQYIAQGSIVRAVVSYRIPPGPHAPHLGAPVLNTDNNLGGRRQGMRIDLYDNWPLLNINLRTCCRKTTHSAPLEFSVHLLYQSTVHSATTYFSEKLIMLQNPSIRLTVARNVHHTCRDWCAARLSAFGSGSVTISVMTRNCKGRYVRYQEAVRPLQEENGKRVYW